MFQGIGAFLIFGADNRYYFSRKSVSFGCIVLTQNKRFYITDSRYETYLREGLSGYEIIITRRNTFYKAIRDALLREGVKEAAFEDDELTVRQLDELKAALPDITLTAGGERVNELRAVKTEDEIRLISEAQSITERAFNAAVDELRRDVTEREIAARIVFEMLSAGADEVAFNPIVSFGDNTAKPHHAPDDRRLQKGDAVMLDIGARFKGYCSDMTRTLFYGEPDKELLKIYDIVLKAQTAALSGIKAGISCNEADSYAREYIKRFGYANEFGHGTGHGVGVKIHEAPSLSAGSDKLLVKDMVVTVEPGIYLPGKGGVRIEDMARVTDTGVINLTAVKKELKIIKK
jgi:Xaa-Pro aminopeptidase